MSKKQTGLTSTYVYFEHLAHEGTAKSGAILVKADQVADALNLDDGLLDVNSPEAGVAPAVGCSTRWTIPAIPGNQGAAYAC
jgi:hypothetical protein